METVLTNVWKNVTTKEVAKIFGEYMNALGVKKFNRRHGEKLNTYVVDGKSTSWNRVQCYYYKDSDVYGESEIGIVLRKEAGDYFIIEKKGKRAFECDYRGVVNYDEELLRNLMEDHQLLFKKLLQLAKTEI